MNKKIYAMQEGKEKKVIKLTAKQQKFCENVALRGMNQTEAYKDAYNTKNMTNKSIKETASQLMSHLNVSSTVAELKQQEQEQTIKEFAISKAKLLQELEDIKTKSVKTEPKIAIDCIKEQGKMSGFYEDTVKLKGDKNSPIQSKITIEFIG